MNSRDGLPRYDVALTPEERQRIETEFYEAFDSFMKKMSVETLEGDLVDKQAIKSSEKSNLSSSVSAEEQQSVEPMEESDEETEEVDPCLLTAQITPKRG